MRDALTSDARNRTIRVLARPAFSNRAVNPYNALIYEPLAALGVQVEEYNLLRAATSRPELLHVHWPESSFNHGLLGARVTTTLLLLAIDRLRKRGTKLVWTIHNLAAHERRHTEHEERFWRQYLDRVDAVIALSDAGLARARQLRPQLEGKPAFVIPHPHYRGAYADTITRAEARQKLAIPASARVLLFFGHIKQYKGVTELLACASQLREDVWLAVAGKPRDAELLRQTEAAAAGHPRIRLDLRHIPAEEAQVFFRAADLVVLPYRDILNSGTALLALSFDRPVHLPSGNLAVSLSGAIGDDWVLRSDISATALEAALDRVRSLPERTQGEHLKPFAPETVAQLTYDCYQRLLA